MKQKKIILDKEFFAFKEIRTKIPEKIESLIVLLERLKNLNSNDLAIIDFISFLEDLLFEKYGKQRNNHNFMKTFLNGLVIASCYSLLVTYLPVLSYANRMPTLIQ